MAWYERIAAYSRGEVAMAYGYNVLASYFEVDDSFAGQGQDRHAAASGRARRPQHRAGRRLCPRHSGQPCRRARSTRHWQAVQFLTSSEAIKLYILNGSRTSPRFSVSADPEVRALSKSIAVVDDLERSGMVQFWPRPPAPEIADIITICGEEMHDMARGLKSVRVALADAQNRADALMRVEGLLLSGRAQNRLRVEPAGDPAAAVCRASGSRPR